MNLYKNELIKRGEWLQCSPGVLPFNYTEPSFSLHTSTNSESLATVKAASVTDFFLCNLHGKLDHNFTEQPKMGTSQYYGFSKLMLVIETINRNEILLL